MLYDHKEFIYGNAELFNVKAVHIVTTVHEMVKERKLDKLSC
jgi:hypothetical protein